jgi:hypothetical protein
MAGKSARWALDAGLAAGLTAILAVVAAVEPKPAPPAPPAALELASAAPPPGEVEIPPLPPLSLAFESGLLDKALPELPPPPPAPEAPKPEKLPDPVQFEEKIDKTRHIRVGFIWGKVGLTRKGPLDAEERRLTFDVCGMTNHTAVSIDSSIRPFFHPDYGTIVKDLEIEGKTDSIDSDKVKGETKSEANKLKHPDGPFILIWDSGRVRFEQRVEYEPGSVSRKVDTLRVRYTLTNLDSRPHKAGMRIMIDTFIGTNDGVPFYIPGRKEIIDKPVELSGEKVPDTILALEKPDLSDPSMMVVQIGLVPPSGSASVRPDAVAVTHWPGIRTAADPVQHLDRVWFYGRAKSFGNDSALVLAWLPVEIAPGKQRTFEYTYGLGSLSGGNPELNLAAFGPFIPGELFQVSAFVKNAKAGQIVTLKLPDGLALAQGEAAEKPVEPQAGVSITKVDWKVKPSADFGGKATLQATLTGAANPVSYTIHIHNPRPTLHKPVVSGKPVAGGVVRITAAVTNAKDGGTVSLGLPAGARLEPGRDNEAEQAVKPGPVDQRTWLVRLGPEAKGNLPFTVKMTNPAATQSGIIEIPPTVPKLAQLVVTGLPQAGSRFRITAQIAAAEAGGTVELMLPDGVLLDGKEEASKPTPPGPQTQVSWVVRAKPNRTGMAKFTARLTPQRTEESTTVELGAAVPTLVARAASDAPAKPGKPFWIVARLYNAPNSVKASLSLPAGVSLAGMAKAEAAMETKSADGVTFAQAAWPVTIDSFTDSKIQFEVSVPGSGSKRIEVNCERGSVIR